jgi:hypothetical protein
MGSNLFVCLTVQFGWRSDNIINEPDKAQRAGNIWVQLDQSSKKSGSWDLGSRTLFWRNPDIFGWDQKSDRFIDIWLICLLKITYSMMTIHHKCINKSFKTIFIQKIILITDLLTAIWKSDIFIPKLGSQTFFFFLEVCYSSYLISFVYNFLKYYFNHTVNLKQELVLICQKLNALFLGAEAPLPLLHVKVKVNAKKQDYARSFKVDSILYGLAGPMYVTC